MKKFLRKIFKQEKKIEKIIHKEISKIEKEEKKIIKKIWQRKWFWLGAIIATLLIAIGLLGFFIYRKVLTSGTSLKIGFTADWEYGYKNKVGNKPTNKAPEALEKAVAYFNNEFHPEVIVVAGDMVESSLSKKKTTIEQFEKINAIFSKAQAKRGYLFGNHDLRKLNKEELRSILGLDGNHNYFDQGDWRFVLMDTNFKKDGTDLGPNHYVEGFVSEAEFEWLKMALDTKRPTILFSHHPPRPDELDGNFYSNPKNLSNGIFLHNFLKQYKNLVLVASGHEPGYSFKQVDGINYIVSGNIATFNVVGNYTSLEAKYNKYTKEAKMIIEKHGERADKFEIKKKIGEFSLWPEKN